MKKLCPICFSLVISRRKDATYCSDSCRVLSYQRRKEGAGKRKYERQRKEYADNTETKVQTNENPVL